VELTQLDIDRKIGGQAEYRNPASGLLCRGEISTMKIEGDTLTINFNWYAKMEEDSGWSVSTNPVSEIDLSVFETEQLDWHQIRFWSWDSPETTTLFAPINGIGGREEWLLDPKTVQGLVLA